MEACETLKDFYLSLREAACQNPNSLPITSRCLDSLIRLCQARAKLELRSIVTKEDTVDVMKLVQESIFEACYLEQGNEKSMYGACSFSNGAGGKGKGNHDPNNIGMLSIPKQTKIYVDKLIKEAERRGDSTFDYQEMVKIGKEINL